jgi:DDE family transposase
MPPCGAKAHIIYDPDADQPLYLMVSPSNVNDITAAKEMPIEAGATYVFDLGYYDYGRWATLHQAGCRIRYAPQVQHALYGRGGLAGAAGIIDPERPHPKPGDDAASFAPLTAARRKRPEN